MKMTINKKMSAGDDTSPADIFLYVVIIRLSKTLTAVIITLTEICKALVN